MTYTPSLRMRVAASAALGSALIAGAIVGGTWTTIADEGYRQLDSHLQLAGSLTVGARLESAPRWLLRGDEDNYIGTVRSGDQVITSTDVVLPALAPGTRNVDIGGETYRVRTTERVAVLLGGQSVTVSVGLPSAPTTDRIRKRHRVVLALAAAAVMAAAVLGWLLGGLATRPFRLLAARPGDPVPAGTFRGLRGATEADQISTAMSELLQQLTSQHSRTEQALAGARDFAALSAHELRTPLTSMRTDLDLLRAEASDPATFEISPDQRTDLIERLARGHRRITETLGALEALAQGEMTEPADFEPVDLVDLVDQVALDQQARDRDVDVTVVADQPVSMRGYAPGLRIAIDNAITNARVHGAASVVTVTVGRSAEWVQIIVDDNGTGLPPAEREAVFGRFRRGTSAHGAGTGLGLALVTQQALLHKGSAQLVDSPLGGLRLVLNLRSG